MHRAAATRGCSSATNSLVSWPRVQLKQQPSRCKPPGAQPLS